MNDKIEEKAVILPPFKHMIMTIGELPSSYVETMTYYEMLVWFTNYLGETVIPAINENGEAVIELQDLFTELQTYVNEYFNNLDVQEEINKKLDEMSENGSLTNLIEMYINPLFNSLSNELTSTLNSSISLQNSRISNVESLVTSAVNGNPLVASNTSEMTDTTKIYVNTTDGKWYYYDGDSWEIGGTYQSTGIGENSITFENLDSNVKNQIYVTIPEYTTTDNYYISPYGTIYSANGFSYTSPIELKIGDTIIATVQGYLTNTCLLCKCDSDGENRSSLINSTNSETTSINYTATENCYVIVCSKTSELAITGVVERLATKSMVDNITIHENNLSSSIQDMLYISNYNPQVTNGFYVYKTGSVSSSSDFMYTAPIKLDKGEIISCKLEGYLNAVALLSKCDYDGTNIKPVIISNGNDLVEITYEATDNCYVILSGKKSNYEFNYINKKLLTYSDIKEELTSVKGIYNNAVFIGDSLTNGLTYISDSSPRYYQNFYNYPYFLNKQMNFENYKNISRGGATAEDWWNRFSDQIVDNNSIYFVWIGTNSTFTDTVSTDCSGDDYTQYASTETGYMGKILGKINSLSNNKIVLLNTYAGSDVDTNNEVLDDFVEKFSCIKVDIKNTDIKNNIYHTAFNGYYNQVHLNNAGNNFVAHTVYKTLINSYYNNPDEFESYLPLEEIG